MLDLMDSIYRSAPGETAIRDWCLDQLDSWAVDHRCERVEAAGVETHLVIAGHQGRDTVVFVAGDRFNAAACLSLLTVLATGFRVVAADVPGQSGLSAGHAGPEATLSWYGAWLGEVVAQTGSPSCLLFGHSFGGAVTLSCDSPLVRGRLAVSTGGLCRLRVTPAVVADFAAWAVFPRPATSRRLLRRLMGPGQTPRPELVGWMTLVARHTRPVSTSETTRPSRNIPTIIATGEADVFLPPSRLAPATRAAFDSDLRVIAGAGHLVTEERPEDLLTLVKQLV